MLPDQRQEALAAVHRSQIDQLPGHESAQLRSPEAQGLERHLGHHGHPGQGKDPCS